MSSVVIRDRSSPTSKGLSLAHDDDSWSDLLYSEVLDSVVLVCGVFLSGVRRGILSEHSLESRLELESESPLREMRVGGPSESELEFCRVNGGVDSGLLFSGDVCLGRLVWVMENIQ